jgi:hypothetical protein
MSDRRASFLICDEVLVAVSGKFTVAGVFTGDIGIPPSKLTLGQLVVLFQIDTPIEQPFKKLVLQVSIPGESTPRQMDVTALIAMAAPMPSLAGRTKITYRVPFPLFMVQLEAGAIEVKVLHEEGELDAGKQWVVPAVSTPAVPLAPPT